MRDISKRVESVTPERSLGGLGRRERTLTNPPAVRGPHGSAIRRVLPAVGLALVLLPAERVAATPVDHAPAAAPVAAPVANDATGPAQTDPFERTNRRLYAISMKLDRVIIGPVTHFYMRVTPTALRNRISAVLYNLAEPRTVINDVLQGRPVPAGRAAVRLVINSTAGVGGLFDVASRAGIAGSQADFGQTLGRYGVGTGPYLFIPFMGPSNVRDSMGHLVDSVTDPVNWATGAIGAAFAGAFAGARGGVESLDTRAQADSELHALDDAIDPYATVRSAFLQNRAATVDQARGVAPALPDFDDPASSDSSTSSASSASSAAPEAPASEVAAHP